MSNMKLKKKLLKVRVRGVVKYLKNPKTIETYKERAKVSPTYIEILKEVKVNG